MKLPHWAKVLGVAAALFAVSQGPFIYGWLSTPPGYRFTGFNFTYATDPYLYWWWMEQGRAGSWGATSPFTTEPQQRGTFMPMWTGLGHLGRTLNIPSRTLYVAATFVGAWLALLVVDWLAKAAGLARRQRLAAVLLAAGASGFGWIAYATNLFPLSRGWFVPLGRQLSDVWEPGMTLFFGASLSPHYPLLEALLGLAVLLYLWRPGRLWLALAATAAATAALGTLRPYDVPLVFCLYALLAVGSWWLERPALGEHLARLAAVGVGGALPAAYFLWLTSVEPVFAQWVSSNVLPSVYPLNYLWGWGLVAVLVVFGLGAVGRAGFQNRAWRVVALWAVAPLVLLYLPFPTQRRATDGWFIPVAVAAAVGWAELSRAVRRRWVLVALGVTLCLTTVARSTLHVWMYAHKSSPALYHPPSLVAATSWLRERCGPRGTAVLVDSDTVGGFTPFATGCHTYVMLGQADSASHITLGYAEKFRHAEALFADAPTSTSADRAWLASSGIAYVLTVKAPRLEVAELELAWEREGIRIYQNRLSALP